MVEEQVVIYITAVRGVMPFSLVHWYQYFVETCCLHPWSSFQKLVLPIFQTTQYHMKTIIIIFMP